MQVCKCGKIAGYWKQVCDICAPAQEEKVEMGTSPIGRLANAAEKYLERCDENDPLHKHLMMAQLNHLDRIHDPITRAADLRQLHRDVFIAAITGLSGIDGLLDDGIVQHAGEIADIAIRQYSPDAVIAEVVG